MSRDTVQYLLTKYTIVAWERRSSMKRKRISPHVLALDRHGSSPARDRPIGHRPLARTRIHGDDADIPRCRPCLEGKGARPNRPPAVRDRAAIGPLIACFAFLKAL